MQDGALYRGMQRIDLADRAWTGPMFGYFLSVDQSNIGSSATGKKFGGQVHQLVALTDKELDPRLYFRRVFVHQAYARSESALTYQDVRARLQAAKLHVYGVKADGSEVKLTTDPLVERTGTQPGVLINDTEQVYKKLVFRFENPLVMDNTVLLIGVDTAPLPAEIQKWEAGEYAAQGNRQTYDNRMEVKVIEPAADPSTVVTKQEGNPWDNPLLIQDITPQMAGGFWNSTSVKYQNCEQELLQPDGTIVELTPKNCRRVKTYTASTWLYDNWGPYRGPLRNFKQIIILPPGVKYVSTVNTTDRYSESISNKMKPKIVPNFNSSGLTALIFEYGDVTRGTDGNLRIDSIFKLDTTIFTETGKNPIHFYTVWDDPSKVVRCYVFVDRENR